MREFMGTVREAVATIERLSTSWEMWVSQIKGTLCLGVPIVRIGVF